jgi:hypothetical protein
MSEVPPIRPVTVFVAGDPGLLAIAKSLLDSAGISFFAKGENLQNIFPCVPWVELQVPADQASEAAALLADLSPGG